jgi:glycosyltransferase involved in cell wall biosynthesis
MRITFMVPHPVSYRLSLFESLSEYLGVELRVLYCSRDPATRAPSGFEDHAQTYESVFMGGRILGTPALVGFPMHANPSIAKWISPRLTDVLIVAGYTYPTAVAAALLARRRAVPWVLLSDSFSGSARHRVGSVAHIKRVVVRRLICNAGAVLVPGLRHRADLVALGVPSGRVFRYHLAPDFEEWAARAARTDRPGVLKAHGVTISPRGGLITTVGRLIPEKDMPTLIRAFAIFQRQHPDWWLQVVGGGPESQRLRELATRLGIGKIVFTGPLEHHEVLKVLAVSSIFAMTSRIEPWGVAVTEALAAGLPCVLTSEVGASELVAGTEAGRVLAEHNPQMIASALSHFADTNGTPDTRSVAHAIARSYSVERGIPAIIEACSTAITALHQAR